MHQEMHHETCYYDLISATAPLKSAAAGRVDRRGNTYRELLVLWRINLPKVNAAIFLHFQTLVSWIAKAAR
jgi:hypothetical protein